jgi:hypothetical protein
MKKIYAVLVAASFSASAFAAAGAPADAAPGATRTAQQSKMALCNKEAAAQGKKRAERRAFMKTCLSGVTNATIAPQSNREKTAPALEAPKP